MDKFQKALTGAASDLSAMLRARPGAGTSPAQSKHKGPEGQAIDSARKDPPPCTDAQTDLVKTAATRIGMTLAEVFSQEITEVKQEVAAVDAKAQRLHDGL